MPFALLVQRNTACNSSKPTSGASGLGKLFVVLAAAAAVWNLPAQAHADACPSKSAFQRSIIDYRWRLNPRFKKNTRKETRYIIVHTSESGRRSALRTLSRGKRLRGRAVTHGGHAHYLIARDGRTYRILNKAYRADHAGLSMWDGRMDISDVSIGIELAGYHYMPITEKQYRAAACLIAILQKVYKLSDRHVLTHSQVAYGPPNRWIKDDHRGRKRCAKNFKRWKAGLGPTWPYDPDVRAGRLAPDPELAAIFYSPAAQPAATVTDGNRISGTHTAWSIAGEDYDSPTTLYRLPEGRTVAGDKIGRRIGWNRIPPGTEVLLNQEAPDAPKKTPGPIQVITDEMTAWSHAGRAYNRRTTIYFFPHGKVQDGTTIADWDDLPQRTRMIIGYRGPYPINRQRTAYRIAGERHKSPKTIYFIPPSIVTAGNKVADFKRLPAGTLIFLPQSGR